MPATIIGNPAVVTGLYQAFNSRPQALPNTYVNNLAYAAQTALPLTPLKLAGFTTCLQPPWLPAF